MYEPNKMDNVCSEFAGGSKANCECYEANILRNARKVNAMTQQQTADKAKINLRHYQMFESGSRKITNASFRIAMAVINALGVNPGTLLHRSEPFMIDKVNANELQNHPAVREL